jgi:hypothetical protein
VLRGLDPGDVTIRTDDQLGADYLDRQFHNGSSDFNSEVHAEAPARELIDATLNDMTPVSFLLLALVGVAVGPTGLGLAGKLGWDAFDH